MQSLLLKSGHSIDPANDVDRIGDLAICDGKVVGINVPQFEADEVIDCYGQLVLPGLIDTHAHVFRYVTGRFGLDADTCGVNSGVTTVIDQGGASCITIPAMKHYVCEPAKTRVLSFISAYLVGGLEGHYYPDLYRPECCDVQATAKAAQAYPELVRGIKAHAELGGYQRWGESVMAIAADIGKVTGLPLYIHLGQLWPSPDKAEHAVDPDQILDSIVPLLKAGDVLAHPFSRHPGGFIDATGHLHPLVREAVAAGVKVDVGHGSHFSFAIARRALEHGIIPDTLGADMHGYNTHHRPHPPATPTIHPDEGDHLFASAVPFSLTSAMTSMLALGLDLHTVIRMVTVNAARMCGMQAQIGDLSPGRVADVTVLHDDRGRWVLRDNDGNQAMTDRWLSPRFCLRAGERFDVQQQLLPQPQAA